MKLSTKDRQAFKCIIERLEDLKYPIKTIRVYRVDMSFFIALDSCFIKTHKKDIGALFVSIFKDFKNTSAIFTFVSKEKIKDRYVEITSSFNDLFEVYYKIQKHHSSKCLQFYANTEDNHQRLSNWHKCIVNISGKLVKEKQPDILTYAGKQLNNIYKFQLSYETKKLIIAT